MQQILQTEPWRECLRAIIRPRRCSRTVSCTLISQPVRLRRAIEKLVAFHCHVFILIRFANSNGCAHPSHQIQRSKKRPTLLSWPSNKEEWQELLGGIYNKHDLTRESGSNVQRAEQKVTTRDTKYEVVARIHCECGGVVYLHQCASFPAFSYIGVSKLSCKACHYWIEDFNETRSKRVRTRASHNKWYGRSVSGGSWHEISTAAAREALYCTYSKPFARRPK